LLAYYFPPIGGAGAQRSLKFVRYLREHGCRTVVVTGPGSAIGRWTPVDDGLKDEIPAEERILRVPGPEPGASAMLIRAQRWLRLNSEWTRWWIDGVTNAAAREIDVDVILASASPYTSIEVGAKLARVFRKPWVADLRDPWALDEMMLYPSGVHRRLEIARMRRLLGSASAIVMSTPEAARQLVAAFSELGDRPVLAIPNGYDAADFAAVEVGERDPGVFRIVHTGYLHTELGLQQRRQARLRRVFGGATPGVDILTRSHVFLLEAVDELLRRDPRLRGRLEVHLAGVLSETDRRIASGSPVTVLHGYLSHAESIALMRSADLLFLPMQNLPPGRRSATVPGKTYEYLASGRPILAAVPSGDARDILARAGHTVCDPDDISAMQATIASSMARRDADGSAPGIESEVVQAFERRELTRRLAEVIRAVVDQDVPAEAPVPTS
jgi:glycosyltransferase involved in cell wall biosynthesis